MAIIDFRSTTYFRGFLLYSFIAAITASLAVHIRLEADDPKSYFGMILHGLIGKSDSISQLIFGAVVSFFITFLIYHIMYFIFGWGGGLLVPINKFQKWGDSFKTNYF